MAATAEGLPPMVVVAMPTGVSTPEVVLNVNSESVDAPLLATYMKSVGLVRVLPTFVPVVPEIITNETGGRPVETTGVARAVSTPLPGAEV